ncbi:VIT-domain-containing protein [Daedalea quercina L-15889]|uniref:VIT-domain-containing protein n=1 Tax=Daedalea quercina L-15889 TaxID=1314783 RepID=A0A165NDM2_9APHY|nr:VIT-domain-containing protein [Daedalea quercina L-15889]
MQARAACPSQWVTAVMTEARVGSSPRTFSQHPFAHSPDDSAEVVYKDQMKRPVTTCGCYLTLPSGREASLPLQSVSAQVHIADVLARVTLTQHFANTNRTSVAAEAKYIFPVPLDGAVCAFEMRTADGKVVVGEVKEARQAEAEFREAVSQKKTAGLLSKAAPDVFVMSLGALPPNQAVKAVLTYVTELTDDELLKQVRFVLPTYVGERYGILPTALHRQSTPSKYARFSISAEIQMASAIEQVVSSSHAVNVTIHASDDSTSRCSVVLDPSANAVLDKDFVLSIQASKVDAPRCVAEVLANKNSVALSLTLVPRFGVKPIDSQEYIFVVDRSGSMNDQSKMDYAKNALLIMLKSLPSSGTMFNVVSFGSSHSSLWPESQPYLPATLNTAVLHVDSMSADMGGTEIASALDSILESRITTRPTSVFVLTDGEVWNIDSLLASLRTNVSAAGDSSSGTYLRVFALGIGYGASTALCNGLARAGNGLCLMATQSEELAGKCSRLLRASRVPPSGNLRNVRIDWKHSGSDPALGDHVVQPAQIAESSKLAAPTNIFDESHDPLAPTDDTGFPVDIPLTPNVQHAPSAVPDFYPGSRFVVSAILSKTTKVPDSVVLRGETPDGHPMELHIPVQAVNFQKPWPPLVHTLAAHRIIQELEDGYLDCLGVTAKLDSDRGKEIARAAIVQFSTEYQLASKYASFIAVNKEDKQNTSSIVGEDNEFELLGDPDRDSYDWIDDIEAMDTSDEHVPGSSGLGPYKPSHSGYSRAQQAAEEGQMSSDAQDYARQQGLVSKAARKTAVAFTSYSGRGRGGKGLGKGGAAWRPRAREAAPSMSTRSQARAQATLDEGTSLARDRERDRERESSPVRGGSIELGGVGQPRQRHPARKSTGGKAPRMAMAPAQAQELDVRSPITPEPNATDDPIAAVARLQSFDGSFQLDNALRALVFSDRFTLDDLKNATPASIHSHPQGEQVWATAIAVAYLKTRAADQMDIWAGLWEKANEYAVQALQGSSVSFHLLVNDAVALL